MTMTPQVAERAAKDLRKLGLTVEMTKPLANEEMVMNVSPDGGKLRIWPGSVTFKVIGDKSHKQAILYADEAAHEIVRKIEIIDYTMRVESALKADFESGARFPMNVPEGTTFEVIGDVDISPRSMSTGRAVKATVKAKVPATSQTFLVGRDEHSHFICILPQRVKTVERAHAVLRPKGIPKDAPRQGEWFFRPATKEEVKAIEAELAHKNGDDLVGYWLGLAGNHEEPDEGRNRNYHRAIFNPRSPGHWLGDPSEDTSHAAHTGVYLRRGRRRGNTKVWGLFVRGYIVDERIDAHPRHNPLFLETWHRPVHNLEVIATEEDYD